MPPQVGPATNGFYQFQVLGVNGTTLGRLVVTGPSTSLPQGANTAVWAWTDARTEFPDKFRLVHEPSGDGSLPGSNHWTFDDGPIGDSESPPSSPETFAVHKIRRGSATGTVVGGFWNKGTGPRTQYWSVLQDQLDADGLIDGRLTGLWFEAVSPPTIDPDWWWRDDTR